MIVPAAAQILHEDRSRLDSAELARAARGLPTHGMSRRDADPAAIRVEERDAALVVQAVYQPDPRIEVESGPSSAMPRHGDVIADVEGTAVVVGEAHRAAAAPGGVPGHHGGRHPNAVRDNVRDTRSAADAKAAPDLGGVLVVDGYGAVPP